MSAAVRRGPVIVVGLDCAPPSLVFDRFAPAMPTLRALRARGAWGPLRSTMPPITIPAWATMTSGKDPGELGLHGFRTRVGGSRALRTTTADDLRADRVWDVAARHGRRCAALHVPPSWPPRPIPGGLLASCLLWPGEGERFAEPESFEREIAERFGSPRPDVERATEGDPARLVRALFDLARQHFDLAEHVLSEHAPDFLMVVEMATDRLHHALWPALDPSDPRHDPASPHARAARDLYAYLDLRIARLSERAGDEATIVVVSDHGARPVLGGLRVNEWLRRSGWLVLRGEPAAETPLAEADVDWARTRAWAEGGYHARIWLNDRGRFGDGALAVDQLEAETVALAAALARIEDGGTALSNRVVRPRDVYRVVRGEAPDLLLFPGDLSHRALGSVGGEAILVPPDAVEGGPFRGGCNHDWDGIFVAAGPGVPSLGRIESATLLDVGRTLLGRLEVPAPDDWGGRDLLAPSG